MTEVVPRAIAADARMIEFVEASHGGYIMVSGDHIAAVLALSATRTRIYIDGIVTDQTLEVEEPYQSVIDRIVDVLSPQPNPVVTSQESPS